MRDWFTQASLLLDHCNISWHLACMNELASLNTTDKDVHIALHMFKHNIFSKIWVQQHLKDQQDLQGITFWDSKLPSSVIYGEENLGSRKPILWKSWQDSKVPLDSNLAFLLQLPSYPFENIFRYVHVVMGRVVKYRWIFSSDLNTCLEVNCRFLSLNNNSTWENRHSGLTWVLKSNDIKFLHDQLSFSSSFLCTPRDPHSYRSVLFSCIYNLWA